MFLNAGMDRGALKRAQVVTAAPSLRRLMRDALKVTETNRREIGIYACGRERGEEIHLTNGTLRTSNNFDSHSFQFKPESLPSLEASTCRRGDGLAALLHTHPDGNHRPSRRDRLTSYDMDLLGCVVGFEGTTCFFGDRDIPLV
jgi:proteasome lid subunit RPN8/RPN11